MNEIILLKLGELVLKGLNRRTFEDRLVANARRRLQAHGKFKVYTKQSTMYVEPQSEDCDLDGAWEAMTKLFGVVGLSRARACAKDKDAMLQTAVEYLGDRLAAAKTFKVESKRADKNFPMTSIQLSQYVGGELDEKYPNLTVDVHHPELTVYLEVRDYAAYVHADPEPGAGGLPVGVGGRAVSLLSGGIDSPVASWMIAKRGIALEMVHFFSYPYTSEEAKQKVLTLAKLLTPWCGRLTVHVVPFTAIQEELRRKCPEELFTVIMRRFMMRIAQEVARLKGRVRQYAVTNGTRVAQERKLSRSGLDRMLDGVFISEIVGTEKPGAAFFDAVFSQIGPCCRDEVMIVGDSLTSDMQGGRSAGILCCWYNPLGEPRPADPRIDYDIRDLRQVEQILDRAGAAEAPAP